VAAALFEPDKDLFVPTELTRGPWNPDAQHGGAPAALVAREAERFENGAEMFVARLTVELLRPVPLTPLRVHARITRPGRKVQLVEVSLESADTQVVRGSALRIRRAQVPIPEHALSPFVAPPGPSSGRLTLPPWAQQVSAVGYHSHAVEHRFVAGGFDEPGPATDWIRLRVPVVAGEETAPIARVAAAADFGNGISWVLSRLDGYSFINPDLTLYLHRYPAGDWVCLEASTRPEPHGVALAESKLWDEQGPIGRSLQSLLVERS
jgi:hypothetical protein